jgi:integrase
MTETCLVDSPVATESTDLWTNGFFHVAFRHPALTSEIREVLRACGSSLGTYLADVKLDNVRRAFNKEQVAEVEKAIFDHFKLKKAILPLRILKDAVYQLNRGKQKCIPMPRLVDRLEKDPNLLTEEFPHAQETMDIWLKAERKWTERCSDWDSAERNQPVAWEMLIAFAAFHSGNLSVGRAVALAEALAEPQRFFACSETRAYADLPIATGTGTDYLFMRWYPDNSTQLLMSRVNPAEVQRVISECSRPGLKRADRNSLIAQRIIDGINRELGRAGVERSSQPKSLKNFLATISLSLRSKLQCALVDFASKLTSRPLLPAAIGRINGDPMTESAKSLIKTTVSLRSEEPDNPEAYAPADKRKDEPSWAKQLRSAFFLGKTEQACNVIEDLLKWADITPAGKQLCTLALKLLRGPASTGDPWAISSVRCSVLTVMRRFALGRKDEDPAGYESVTFTALFKEALDDAAEDSDAPVRLQRTVAWALREYHRHLVHDYDAKSINEAKVFRVPSGLLPVDARVISLDDLFRAIEIIKTAQNPRWSELYRRIALGQIVLLFLAGLRRMEALGLDPADVWPSPLFDIFVRENRHRGLKTPNAERRTVLSTFAYPFNELLDYVWDLYDEAKERGTALDCGISDDVIVPIIHEALFQATGDEDCHAHTLRHSAAHWMLLRLALSDLAFVPNLFPHLPLTTRWLEASRTFRGLFYSNNDQSSSNDHAWAVASTLGHSNPSISMRSYVHCLDLWLSLALEFTSSPGGENADEHLRKLSGLPHSTAHTRLRSTKKEEPLRRREFQAEFTRGVFRERFGLPELKPENSTIASRIDARNYDPESSCPVPRDL